MLKKKIIVVLTAFAFLLFGAAGILPQAALAVTAEKGARELYEERTAGKAPNGREEFLLGSWVTYYDYDVTPLDDQMSLMHESGLNFAFAPFDWYDRSVYDSLEDWKEIDELCTKYGMYYLLSGGENGQGADQSSLDNGTAWAKEMGEYMMGYHLKDEPPRATFDSLSAWYKKYLQADPDHIPYVNLYPSYVGAQGLGGTYREYLQAWIDAVGAENMLALSHDYYPFGTESTNTGIFSDMEDMRYIAYQNGKLPTHAFLQSTGWTNMRMPDMDEIRWNAYSYLAYGFKALSYFNYCNPGASGEGFDVSLIMPDGTIPDRQLFDDVADFNWSLRLLGTELMKLDAVHAYHTTSRYAGTEVLPSNFFIRPDSSCDFVISLMESKDDTGYSVMLFNNSWSQGATQTFILDSFSGAEGLEWFNLETGEWEDVRVSSGMFTLSFQAGEGKLLRIKGDLRLDTEIKMPVSSLPAGVYGGPQTVELTAEDGAEIYYTLDGSYPTRNSNLYTGKITIGNKTGNAGVALRAIAVRQNTASEALTAEYVILDESRNIAKGADVFLSVEGAPYRTERTFGAEVITDGSCDTDYTYGTKAGKYGWAVVDLGESYPIDRIRLDLYDNAAVSSVIVQISDDITFRKNVTALLNTDRVNLSGYGGEFATDAFPSDGEIFADGTSARYVRVYCAVNNRSLFTEIEVYQKVNDGMELSYRDDEWRFGGKWDLSAGIAHTADGSLADALTRKDITAENFVVKGIFSFGENKYGMIGFELFKKSVGSQGVRVGVTATGQLRWQIGNKFGYGATQSLFDPSSFELKIAAVGSFIVVKVNGGAAQIISLKDYDKQSGLVAVYAGNSDMSVTSLTFTEVSDVYGEIQNTIVTVQSVLPVTVELNTVYADVLSALPSAVLCADDAGKEYLLNIDWYCEDYNYALAGTYYFYGELQGAVNVSGLRAQVAVTVRPKINYSFIDAMIGAADRLDPNAFTEKSWNNVAVYYDNAISVREDNTLPQNAINVAANQLDGAIQALVYKDAAEYKTALVALRNSAVEITAEGYTKSSYRILQTVVAQADDVIANGLSTREQVTACERALTVAIRGLSRSGDVSALAALIAEAESVDLTQYTEKSAQRFTRSLQTAKIFAAMSDTDEEILECLATDLAAKMNALVKK